jgi:colanic acid/amylovoran biosynthesis protein
VHRVNRGGANDEDMAPVKVCILGATFETPNMGVSMLAAGAIHCMSRSFPGAQITLCDYARQGKDIDFRFGGKLVLVRFINIRFSKKLYLANNVALLIFLVCLYRVAPLGVKRRMLQWNAYLKEIVETDLFVSIAYGDSFSDIYGMERLLYVVLPIFLALLAGKKLVLLPQTIGPFKSKVGLAIAKVVLKHAQVIYSRDKLGLKTTRELLRLKDDNSKLRFCHDMAFAVDAVAPSKVEIEGFQLRRDGTSVLVGMNVSGLLMAGGYTKNNMFGLRVQYQQLVYDLIDMFITKKAARVLLVPHVLAAVDDLESDSGACESIFDALKSKYQGKIGVTRGMYNYNEIKYVIGQCDFFVGARMHACIGALSQNIPTVPIAYSDKFVGIMESLGLQNLVVDPRTMKEPEIVETVERVYETRDALRHELETSMPKVKQDIYDAIGSLDTIMNPVATNGRP